MLNRLSKVINKAGISSRRDAERLIFSGRVTVNGVLINDVVTFVTLEDHIAIDGVKIDTEQAKPRLWIYHKPAGLITTHHDTHGRPTVFESIVGLPRVISIGRLDRMSEGLLLLTNNGALARKFELPSSNIERIYHVEATGDPSKLLMAKFPITIDEISYSPKKIISTGKAFQVVLTSGKNREIRRIFKTFELNVSRLIRTHYGQFSLDGLKVGEYKEVQLCENLTLRT